jgi:hypothetical protein
MERLSLALFSFYREDPEQARRLDPLLACRLSRGWASLRIECRDLAHREVVSGMVDLLRPPLEALGLAREIRLLVAGHEPLVFPVCVPLPGSLLAYDQSIGD